jgi:hypothetical protein
MFLGLRRVWRSRLGDLEWFTLLFSPRAKRVRDISIALGLMPVMRTHLSPNATSDTHGTSPISPVQQHIYIPFSSRRLRPPLDRHPLTSPHQMGSHPRQRLAARLGFHCVGARPVAAVCRDRDGVHPSRHSREEDRDRARGGVSVQAADGRIH